MIDPPRPEAVTAVQICRSAGIYVKMITDDHAGTATAIAGQIGLAGSPGAEQKVSALTGQQLAEINEKELIDVIEQTTIFARVAPEQKLNIVRALQTMGHVVAMTGDGVNDAPALKQADIGIAMGITDTDVAKDAADMLLTDDNFASIEAAVEEGRGVFDNLTKFITWTLPTNLGEGLVILTSARNDSNLLYSSTEKTSSVIWSVSGIFHGRIPWPFRAPSKRWFWMPPSWRPNNLLIGRFSLYRGYTPTER